MWTVASPLSGRTVFCFLVPLAIGATPAFARETIVTGTAGTVVDYRSRSYKQGEVGTLSDDGDRKKIGIQPEVLIVSKDVRDYLSLRYSPTLSYDYVIEDNQVDHQLDLQGERWLSQAWSISVSENYIRSDDPGTPTRGKTSDVFARSGGQTSPFDTPTELSQDQNGRKYWTNTASVQTSYVLDKDSRINGGYSYSVLRNDESGGGYEDYDRHTFYTDLTHGFTQNWRGNLGLDYTRGLYDRTQGLFDTNATDNGTPDLDQYGFRVGVDFVRTPHDFYPFKYSLNESRYADDTRPGNEIHSWSLGWDHAFDSRTRVALGGGPSFAKTEGLDGTWGYNAYATLMRTYEHASLSLELSKVYQTNNFSGNSADSGLTDTYSARATFSYRHTQNLAFNVYGGYSMESNFEPQGIYQVEAGGGAAPAGKTGGNSYDKNIYDAGIGCTYTFGRWYTAGLNYGYYVSDGNLANDQYTDHQLLFTLRASHELWRW
ncbi:MAG: hypothetical protein LBD10_06065 [Desulfobulbus sp.]|jgi:hypothetical protein|uniref:hypothetical protein n=1 Tax=Desulfobulbus sp. TaxID=895 RepID=UPI0028428BB7|nr:hypothetical protein [Desulfobulbus sp.]MDR2549745.1 hypothetical protein [Desulfobulbus sp.]